MKELRIKLKNVLEGLNVNLLENIEYFYYS